MGTYRISRNIEASIIDYLTSELADASWNVSVEKSYANVSTSKPTIVVSCQDTDHDLAETGSKSTVRTAFVILDFFCENDGQRLDLKDFVISVIKQGCPYYVKVIADGEEDSSTQDGNLTITIEGDAPINYGVDKENLEKLDRYKHRITLSVSRGKVEA